MIIKLLLNYCYILRWTSFSLFEDASVRTKDGIVSELLDKYNSNELLYAASKSLKRDKRFLEAKVVKKYVTKNYPQEHLH